MAEQSLNIRKFDDFLKVADSGADLERFRKSFRASMDLHGAVSAMLVGFHFSLDGEAAPDGGTAQAKDMLDTFKPVVVYVGSPELKERLARELGWNAVVSRYYEGGGFAVVLRTPLNSILTASDPK